MRIGIEAQRIFRPHKHGMDMVALELIRNLQAIDQTNEYFILVNPDTDQRCLQAGGNFNIIEVKKSSYPVWEQIHLPAMVKKLKLDLLHCTSNTAPVRCPVPLILTLHDIIYLEGKSHIAAGTWYQRMGNLYRIWNVPKVFQTAKKVITVSEFEKNNIENYFKNKSGKVEAVYNGVSTHFQPCTTEEVMQCRKKFGLPDTYMLFLGNTAPKKNLKGVLQALHLLLEKKRLNQPLVMPDFGKTHLQKMLKELNAPELESFIHLTGYVPNQELPAVYSGASLFLYPSLRESFGLPILEAMACGCPVITSSNSSMIEIGADAALLIDPYDPVQLANAIEKLVYEPQFAKSLVDKGYKRAALYSYRKGAEKILQMYQSIQ